MQVLFNEFKETSFLPQAFLLMSTLRNLTFHFSLTILFSYPLAQVNISLLLTLLSFTYIISMKLFTSRLDWAQQLICELVILAVNVSLVTMGVYDVMKTNASREILGMIIIYASLFFQVFGLAFVIPKLYLLMKESVHTGKKFVYRWKDGEVDSKPLRKEGKKKVKRLKARLKSWKLKPNL